MNLAISNIAWDAADSPRVYAHMIERGVKGLEAAPSLLLENAYFRPAEDVAGVRSAIEGAGLRVVSLQALLFGKPDFALFGAEAGREEMLGYLERSLDFASALGAGVVVFGSPKNRLVGLLDRARAEEIAVSALRRLGQYATSRGVRFLLEPNPPAYGCDFVVNVAEALDIIKKTGSEGIGLNLDLGAMTMNSEDYASTLREALPHVGHVHISEPMLAPVPQAGTGHEGFAQALHGSGYMGWVSVEMKNSGLDAALSAIDFLARVYG